MNRYDMKFVTFFGQGRHYTLQQRLCDIARHPLNKMDYCVRRQVSLLIATLNGEKVLVSYP